MSARLGAALAAYIKRMANGESAYIAVEGVDEATAQGIAGAWDDSTMPPLAIVATNDRRFGRHALGNRTATSFRNVGSVCLVLCQGQRIPDSQGMGTFVRVSPGELLSSLENLLLLAEVPPKAPLDGPARPVRAALTSVQSFARPSALAVANYFDELAKGADALACLPIIGAFRDVSPGALSADRIIDNLRLAATRRSEEILRPAALADIRRRAQRAFEERGARTDTAKEQAGQVMTLLQSGSDDLLTLLSYDEARDILEQRREGLPEAVERDVDRYERTSRVDLPWDDYRELAGALVRPDDRRAAAQELLRLDDSEQRQVFSPDTRKRLEALLRDRAVDGSQPSCPEAAIARAIALLGEPVRRVEVLGPDVSARGQSRTAALRSLTMAAARLRLRPLMRKLEERHGVEIDGDLLLAPDEGLADDLFADASLGGSSNPMPDLVLRLRGARTSAMVRWRPDADDVMTLRFCSAFSEAPCLTFAVQGEVRLSRFVGGIPLTSSVVRDDLLPLARRLQNVARQAMTEGLTAEGLTAWSKAWRDVVNADRAASRRDRIDALVRAGALTGDNGSIALGSLAPLKAEWLAAYLSALHDLVEDAMSRSDDPAMLELEVVAPGIAGATATHYPPYLQTATRDAALLPASEGRVWSAYGVRSDQDSAYSGVALGSVLTRLLRLQPDVAGHLRCMSVGPGSADLLVAQAAGLVGTRVDRAVVGTVEVFCVADRPTDEVLDEAARRLGRNAGRLLLRYLNNLEEASAVLGRADGTPSVHLAVVTGITAGGERLLIEPAEVPPPRASDDVLFAPRTWLRPKRDRRTLLMPPTASATMQAWLRLANAVDEDWPDDGGMLRVPEIRTGSMEVAGDLAAVHRLALWVTTIDRYATRDSLEQALGEEVAILHQERRLSAESPLSLVISQRSGGPADRAIVRSLVSAGIVRDLEVANDLGRRLRETASQGYGILALEAATTGAGINELVGHVVAFSLLGERTTPWPLPPGCRVLLINLDDYQHWFPGRRGDLLALALDRGEGGVHGAIIEVKMRRSDPVIAGRQALDQVRQSLAATQAVARPDTNPLAARLWLNRIAEAAYAVARESRFRLTEDEIDAIEDFRLGGSLEWAGLGLVFGPSNEEGAAHYHQQVGEDRVPIVIYTVELTQNLLESATATELTQLRTTEAEQPPLEGGRRRRRPEARIAATAPVGEEVPNGESQEPEPESPEVVPPVAGEPPSSQAPTEPSRGLIFEPPILGWALTDDRPIVWPGAGVPDVLPNGHVEIWGSSGAGKTQFTKSLLAQLAHGSGTRFGIADFKNDYGGDFPDSVGGEFIDLWEEGAQYNPLALDDDSDRAITKNVIELRDTVDVAVRSFTRMGHRQINKLREALEEAYAIGRREHRWPTLATLHDCLDADLIGVIGDLTRNDLFRDGPPLGDIADENVIFGLWNIPGNGQTTVLAAGFILAALLQKMQNLLPAPNTLRYMVAVDEAHRVASFKAIDTMIREGRSKGLAVLLATQQPGDLPEVIATNAQTKVCFRLPDATAASAAAKRLNPRDSSLPEQIRTLAVGEAFVSLGGRAPELIQTAQYWRDRSRLGIPD